MARQSSSSGAEVEREYEAKHIIDQDVDCGGKQVHHKYLSLIKFTHLFLGSLAQTAPAT